MSNETMMMIAIISFILSGMTPFMINQITMRKYLVTHSAEKALYTMQSMKQYLHLTVLMIGAFTFTQSFLHASYFSPSRLTILLFMVTYISVIFIYGQLVFHKIVKKIRKTETNLKDEFWTSLKDLSFILLPVLAYKCYRVFIDGKWNHYEWQEFLFYVLFMLFLQVVYPYLVFIYFNAKPIQNHAIRMQVDEFLVKLNTPHTQIYEFPSKKSKTAHAWISGILVKKIFIADYLIEKLTPSEILAVVAHEVGHTKKHHHLVKLLLFILVYPMFKVLNKVVSQWELWLGFEEAWVFGTLIIAGVLLLYYMFVYQAVSRMHEYQADQYVLETCDRQDLIAALEKITKLNLTMKKMNKFIEKFQSHPSMEKRIHCIEQAQQENRLPAARK
jgi:STE24 endopeptidase